MTAVKQLALIRLYSRFSLWRPERLKKQRMLPTPRGVTTWKQLASTKPGVTGALICKRILKCRAPVIYSRLAFGVNAGFAFPARGGLRARRPLSIRR